MRHRLSQRTNTAYVTGSEFRIGSTLHIDRMRDRLQMIRFDTCTHATQMVKVISGRGGAVPFFPRNDMRFSGFAVVAPDSVSVADMTEPDMTRCVVSRIDYFELWSNLPCAVAM